MSEHLKVGDRVRVVGLEKETPSTETAAPILRGEVDGEVTDFTEKWTVANFGGQNYHVPTKNLQRVSPRRTFEEIGNELSASLGAEWGKVLFFDNRMELRSVNNTYLVIFDNGGVLFDVDAYMSSEIRLCLFQLNAISAACTEIAANDAAEHGKENQQ